MKLYACAIWDIKTAAYLPVFFVRAPGEAMRHFMDAVGDGKSPMSRHPEDYELYQLATFDDVDGTFTPDVQALMSGEAAKFVDKGQAQVGS